MATLQVESRENASSRGVQRLRSKGVLPMALIVKGKGTKLVQAPQKDVKAALKKAGSAPVFGVSVDTEAQEIKVVIKDVQRDSISRDIIHLTLQQVNDDDVIRFNVPITFHGEPDSVTKKRSSLMTPLVSLEIYAKPGDIPDHLHVDLSKMEDNDKVVVGDIQLPNGVTTHVPEDAVVATTFHMRAVVLEATPAAGEAEAVAAEGAAAAAPGAPGAKAPAAGAKAPAAGAKAPAAGAKAPAAPAKPAGGKK
jgi:large subunit ribosomal protein L25